MVSAKDNQAKLQLLTAMVIFGTIGIFRRYIPLPSGMVAMTRGFVGTLFLLLVIKIRGGRIDIQAIKRNLFALAVSGAMIGFNWILLFEAYQYTTVATATLCYYMAPIIVTFASAVLFRERLTTKKTICALAALSGMILVSGVLDAEFSGMAEVKGILLGLGAAVLYAAVILMNKTLKSVEAFDKTLVQLGSAAMVLVPYVLLAEDMGSVELTPLMVVMLAVVGIVHTGVAYVLYFGAMGNLKAQTIALFSYIDPILAVVLSAVLLREAIGVTGVAGAVLVLGATMVSERE